MQVSTFQDSVAHWLTRNRALIDILSQYQEKASRVNLEVVKAATHCGCISIEGRKQKFPKDATLDSIGSYTQSFLEGELCPKCREIVEEELGSLLFYVAAMCNTLGISLYDVLLREENRMSALGKYSLR